MMIIAYKILTHARFVGFYRFKDGNKFNYNKMNLEGVGLNHVLNDILDKKYSTNWDIVLTKEERNYVKNNVERFLKCIEDKHN